MEKVKLKDLGEICTGNTPSKKNKEFYKNNDICFFKPSDIDEDNIKLLNNSEEYISEMARNKARILPKGTILVTCIGTIGKIGILEKESACNQQINAIIPNNRIDGKYLAYLIYSKKMYLQKKANAPVVPIINKTDFSNIELNIYDQSTQIKIVNELDKVQEIKDIRKKQIEELDELIKSQFVEMFGDPILNPKCFPLKKVEDIVEFQGGSQPDKKFFEYTKTKDNIRLIQIRDYKTNDFITYIPKNLAKRFCDEDDIMIGRYGPPIFQILQGIKGSYNVALMKAIPKKGNKEFVRYFLKQECLLHYLEGLSQRTAGQAGIEMPKLKKYPFPYPPIELQNKFADFVKQIDKQKFEIQKSLEEIQKLQESLMNKYFGG